MKLRINCKNCNEYFDVKANVITRSELEDKWGRYFTKQCSNCLSSREYHVNNVKAEMDRQKLLIIAIFFILIAGIFTMFLWNMGVIASMTIVLPTIAISYYAKIQTENASVFNRILIKRNPDKE